MSVQEPEVVVIGATGTVGSRTVQSLRERGARVRILVRSARRLSAVDGVEIVEGDLRDEAAVARALEGMRSAFYVSPHEPDEEALGTRFVEACERMGVRLVFVGVHIDGGNPVVRGLRRLLYGRMLPHYRPKFRVAERARCSRASPIVLMPSNFFQNDELFMDSIRAGIFAQPFDRAINRVDVADIADAAAIACLDPSLPAGVYPVMGPESLDGPACAEVWSRALERTVRYDRSDFERLLADRLSGKKRDDFVRTYEVIGRFEMKTRSDEVARTTALLGRPPRSYDAYVRETRAPSDAEGQRMRRSTATPKS